MLHLKLVTSQLSISCFYGDRCCYLSSLRLWKTCCDNDEALYDTCNDAEYDCKFFCLNHPQDCNVNCENALKTCCGFSKTPTSMWGSCDKDQKPWVSNAITHGRRTVMKSVKLLLMMRKPMPLPRLLQTSTLTLKMLGSVAILYPS